MAIDYKPEQNDYTNLTPFKAWLMNQINTWGVNNFPFLEEDFDKLTNYGMMMKLMKAVNDVITNENLVEDDMSKLYGAFTELQTYINNYFDILDVQEEINNKLDEMTESGELTNLIKNYVDPIYQEYQEEINDDISNFKEQTNSSIYLLRTEVESIASGTPIPVNSTSEMTDTTKVYLLLTDGYIYYYNGTAWVQGFLYQATAISDNDPIIVRIDDSLKNYSIGAPLYDGRTIKTSSGIVDPTTSNTNPGWKSWVITCEEGDVFTITGTGGATPRLWCFIDSTGNILANAPSMYVANQISIVAPENTDRLVINLNGAGIIYKGYSVDNRINPVKNKADYVDNELEYKINGIFSIGNEIEPTSRNNGLYDIERNEVFESEVSHYNIYNVTQGKKYYVTGKTSTNAQRYSLLGIYDEKDTLLLQYGTTNSTSYNNELITIPIGGVKMLVNGAQIESTSILLKECDVSNDLDVDIPNYMINILSNKHVGTLSKPYFCISCDDGENTLYTNTIPNIIEQIYQDTNVKVPFTFGLMSDSPVVLNATELNAVKDMITNYGCSVAQHGHGDFTTLTKDQLVNYLDVEKTYFNNINITTKGVIYPSNRSNEIVRVVCGGLYNVGCGGGANQELLYNRPRDNMFHIYRGSIAGMTLQQAKDYIDYAYDHNYLLCMFFHDNTVDATEGETQKIVDIVEYAITKGMNFTTIGDIPNLV